jgi:hypothetical protein
VGVVLERCGGVIGVGGRHGLMLSVGSDFESLGGLISFGRGTVYSDLTQSSEIIPFRTTDRERNRRADNPLGV